MPEQQVALNTNTTDDLRTEYEFLRVKADYLKFIDAVYRKFPIPELLELRDIIDKARNVNELITNVEQYQREILSKFRSLLPAFREQILSQRSKAASLFDLSYQFGNLTKEAVLPAVAAAAAAAGGVSLASATKWVLGTIGLALLFNAILASMQRMQEGPARHDEYAKIEIPGLGHLEIKPETELFSYTRDPQRVVETGLSFFGPSAIRRQIAWESSVDLKRQIAQLNMELKRQLMEDIVNYFNLGPRGQHNVDLLLSSWIDSVIVKEVEEDMTRIRNITDSRIRLEELRSMAYRYRSNVLSITDKVRYFIMNTLAYNPHLPNEPYRDDFVTIGLGSVLYPSPEGLGANTIDRLREIGVLGVLKELDFSEEDTTRSPEMQFRQLEQQLKQERPTFPHRRPSDTDTLRVPIGATAPARSEPTPSSVDNETRAVFEQPPTTQKAPPQLGPGSFIHRSRTMDSISKFLESGLGEIKTPDLSK